MTALLTLGGGFLLAVIWMDLIFDVQALRGPRNEVLPEPALAREIARAHVGCFAAMLGFVAIQLFAG
jgi:hypothetical protein